MPFTVTSHFGGYLITNTHGRMVLIQPGDDTKTFADEWNACDTLEQQMALCADYFEAHDDPHATFGSPRQPELLLQKVET